MILYQYDLQYCTLFKQNTLQLTINFFTSKICISFKNRHIEMSLKIRRLRFTNTNLTRVSIYEKKSWHNCKNTLKIGFPTKIKSRNLPPLFPKKSVPATINRSIVVTKKSKLTEVSSVFSEQLTSWVGGYQHSGVGTAALSTDTTERNNISEHAILFQRPQLTIF